jgi:ATP-dependent DNA helicase RecQ
MIDYAESANRCRVVMLLDYFGEESDRCGTCDICRERNELDLSKYEFDIILEEIKNILSEQSPDPAELVKQINQPEEKVIKVIRWLLDHNKITHDSNRGLIWKK